MPIIIAIERMITWLFIIVVLKCYMVTTDLPCSGRVGDPGQGQICVCNSSYCDTVERPPMLPSGQYYHYTTSNSTPGFTKSTGSFTSDSQSEEDYDILFTVNNEVQYQEIIGFGGSFSDSAGINIKSLPVEAADKLIRSYFGTDGVEYTLCRMPIGCSDFSGKPYYTLDDTPYDVNLEHFNLTEEDYTYKIPYIQKAMAVSERGIKLYGCTWNSPQWMKTSYDNPDGGVGYVKSEYLRSFARYHVKFVEAYKQNGIDIWALSGGNEVLLGVFVGLNCTHQLAPFQRNWLKNYLMPELEASNLSDVKFLTMDDMRPFAMYWMDRFAEDPEAYKMTAGIALHWYFDFFTPPSFLDNYHQKHPEQLIVYTESSINPMFFSGPNDTAVELGSWGRAALYAHNIIENLNHWTNGYIDWNLALNPDGGPYIILPIDAAVIVNNATGEFYKQPIFYAICHFSKFIPPGSRRVLITTNQNQTKMESYSNDSLYNNIELSSFQEYLQSVKTGKTLRTRRDGFGVQFAPIVAPEIVESVATTNSDGSNTVVVLNNKNVTSRVKLEIAQLGSVVLDLEEKSINTIVYWL